MSGWPNHFAPDVVQEDLQLNNASELAPPRGRLRCSTKSAKGEFLCTGAYPTESKPAPLEFVVRDQKLVKSARQVTGAPSILTAPLVDRIGQRGAEAEAVTKGGSSRYA